MCGARKPRRNGDFDPFPSGTILEPRQNAWKIVFLHVTQENHVEMQTSIPFQVERF